MDADYRANPSFQGGTRASGSSGDETISREDPNAGGIAVSPGLDLGIESYDLGGELHEYNTMANGGTAFAVTQPGDHP